MPKQDLYHVSCEERCEKLQAAFQMVWLYSHEISDQVTIIMGNSELIHDALPVQGSVRKHLDDITRSARRIGVAAAKISSLREHVKQEE